jgi:uncharacterized phage-associated protein
MKKIKPTHLSKNAQIIKYIVERLPDKLGRTHLLKLIYLADYHSHRLFGKPISEFKYIWYQNGPFDKSFYGYINSLKNSYIEKVSVQYPSGCHGYVYRNIPAQMKYDNISEPEFYLLQYVIENYSKVDLQTLLDEIVYETEPMKDVIKKKAYGKRLPMKIVDNFDKEIYKGLNPEDIISGKKAVHEGKAHSLEEVFSALQS